MFDSQFGNSPTAYQHRHRITWWHRLATLALMFAVTVVVSCSDTTNPETKVCSRDSDCGLGSVCAGDQCVAGCTSGRDCPTAAPLCDPAMGERGTCVTCLTDAQCARGSTCDAGACVASCSSDRDCPGQHCDATAKRCVECLSNSQCPLGDVCGGDNKCIAGCFGDRDCQPSAPFCTGATAAAPGACVQCVGERNCGSGKACVANMCVSSCNNNQDCPGQVCNVPAHVCVECLTTSSCALGSVCAQNECVAGCESSRDCTTSKPICDPAAGANGTCYQCTANRDCAGGKVCNNHVCEVAGVVGEGASCVTAQCDSGLSCDPSDNRCRALCLLPIITCPRATDICTSETFGSAGFCVPSN
jgi:Cys-rich repeat protein